MLDIENHADLIAWLRHAGHIAPHESPRCATLAGGVSNRTVLLQRDSGQAWVLKQALPKLRTAIDWFADPARIDRESAGIRWLSRIVPGRVPGLIFHDPAEHVLAMSAVPSPHDNLKRLLLGGRIEPGHIDQAAALLAEIHRQGMALRGEVEPVFRDRSYFESLRLEPYYLFAAGQVPPAAPFLRQLVDATRSRRISLVHGDYSPKNMLIHAGALVLLDHEVIHFGDPAFDVGFFLAHLLSKARHLPSHRARLVEMSLAFWRRYREGVEYEQADAMSARHTLGCLLARVAGRSQLEYLSDAERAAQRRDVVKLIAEAPATMPLLIERFAQCL